jgi:hypothetical protein
MVQIQGSVFVSEICLFGDIKDSCCENMRVQRYRHVIQQFHGPLGAAVCNKLGPLNHWPISERHMAFDLSAEADVIYCLGTRYLAMPWLRRLVAGF